MDVNEPIFIYTVDTFIRRTIAMQDHYALASNCQR